MSAAICTQIGDWGRQGVNAQKKVAKMMSTVADCMPPAFIISTGDNFYSRECQDSHEKLWWQHQCRQLDGRHAAAAAAAYLQVHACCYKAVGQCRLHSTALVWTTCCSSYACTAVLSPTAKCLVRVLLVQRQLLVNNQAGQAIVCVWVACAPTAKAGLHAAFGLQMG